MLGVRRRPCTCKISELVQQQRSARAIKKSFICERNRLDFVHTEPSGGLHCVTVESQV
jgi:hypothetical protein